MIYHLTIAQESLHLDLESLDSPACPQVVNRCGHYMLCLGFVNTLIVDVRGRPDLQYLHG